MTERDIELCINCGKNHYRFSCGRVATRDDPYLVERLHESRQDHPAYPVWRYLFAMPESVGVEPEIWALLCETPKTVKACDNRFAQLCEVLDMDPMTPESDVLFEMMRVAGLCTPSVKKAKPSGYWYIQAPDGTVVPDQRHRNPLTLGQHYAKSISREWWDLIAEGYTAVRWPFNDGEEAV